MLKNRDIIITSIQSWNVSTSSNIKNIAYELSKCNRVLYVCPPVDKYSLLPDNIPSDKGFSAVENRGDSISNIHQINKGLYVLIPCHNLDYMNRIPFNSLFDYVNKMNNKRLSMDIQFAIEYIGIKNYIHICDSDLFRSFYLKELLKPVLSVYYSRDNLLAVNYWKKHVRRIEPLFFKKADLVLTNSVFLARRAKLYNKNSFFVGQGCDVSAYKPNVNLKIPLELQMLKKPVIGYMGYLSSLLLDIEILVHIAKKRPDWQLVLVGSENKTFKNSVLHKLPNVTFTGFKKENELAEYLNAFDVAINPQGLNEITIRNYPRKIDEYLAMGKPVVATKLETMTCFKDYVSLAETKDKWVDLIDQELVHDSRKQRDLRMSFASCHTWKNNVYEIGRRILLREEELYSGVVDYTHYN